MLKDSELSEACAKALGELTIQVEPQSLDDCQAVAEMMIATALASLVVNCDFPCAMQALGGIVQQVAEAFGVQAHIDVREEPACSTPSH